MTEASARPADDIDQVVSTYGNQLYRICLVMLKNPSDAEDVLQDTFIRYLQKAPHFDTAEHEKAWLFTVAANRCRDVLRFRKRHPYQDIDSIEDSPAEQEGSGILDALGSVPEKFRIVLLMHYVEEYRVDEIAGILHKSPSAIKMRLQKGRHLLQEAYRKEYL